MACKTSYELNHNFAKLADETGFTFNTHRPRVHIDWNRIKLIDIDGLIRERRFTIIEQHLNDILDCVFESEFDVRVLDEGVLKMFRLAQLTIEYQQFCRHYLDRSVCVLREELGNTLQNMETTKKGIREKEDELKRLRKKSKNLFRPPLMYGNENIANMILKTLSKNNDAIASSSIMDGHQYNKCTYCDKVFLNQLYLKSHLSRRHADFIEAKRDGNERFVEEEIVKIENEKLNQEVSELRTKLIEMENTIMHLNKPNSVSRLVVNEIGTDTTEDKDQTNDIHNKPTEDFKLIEKLEEWKKEEQNKYSKDMEILRHQICETINSLKEKESSKSEEKELILQLTKTIQEQGRQINMLKNEIGENVKRAENGKKDELEAQLQQWAQKVEYQTKQYEEVVENLKKVAREAQTARDLAEVERNRSAKLQALLNERSAPSNHVPTATREKGYQDKSMVNKSLKSHESSSKERKTLEELHKKAQELLQFKPSSSSGDSSIESLSNDDITLPDNITTIHRQKTTPVKEHFQNNEKDTIVDLKKGNLQENKKNGQKSINKRKTRVKKKLKPAAEIPAKIPSMQNSPIKVVRAKLTEEVNNILVEKGIDPLKKSVLKSDYDKQRTLLQQQRRSKIKMNPTYESTRHAILTLLDAKATLEKEQNNETYKESITSNKIAKHFSLTSVISNVKNRALSFVKQNANERSHLSNAGRNNFNHTIPLRQKQESKAANQQQDLTRNINSQEQINSTNINRNMGNRGNDKLEHFKEEEASSRSDDSDTETTESDHKYYDSSYLTNRATTKSVDNLMKSPVRRPSTADGNYKTKWKSTLDENVLGRTQSESNILEVSGERNKEIDSETVTEQVVEKATSRNKHNDDTHSSPKQSKGVLKNALSTSSLNKKKVLFNLDAIQMKSVSTSPSQSTERSETNEKYELGLVNLDDEEWEISSIENEPTKESTNITLNLNPRKSPKIAELTHTIESQLARRTETPSTAIVGGVDVLAGPKRTSVGGSNTSLGSSVFDDEVPVPNINTFVKPKLTVRKDDSDLELSEFSIEDTHHKNKDYF